ncbi:hypothetical protein FSP39_009300 [Pinctada imbricata]|uniref:Uncharacterized protein n=1 Tax=Pinctada imbricata TaxID=66713 RepID=A0AA88YBS9_PINIB|nr:hypothetical protein FSP39_009300 [Pinctada imbricata]
MAGGKVESNVKSGLYPFHTSDWKNSHLQSLAIFYKDECVPLQEIIGCMKSLCVPRSRPLDDDSHYVPHIVNEIVAFTKQIWSSSVKTEDLQQAGEFRHTMEQLLQMKRDFFSNENHFRTEHSDLLKDNLNFRIFNDWCSHMMRFLSWLDIFLRRLRDDVLNEGACTQLFMQFSMIFLLVPEIGESLKSQMWIGGDKVSGIPAVRFSRFSMNDKSDTVQIVTMAEMKDLDSAKRKCCNPHNPVFKAHENLSNSLLGQHGIELLLEAKRSYFRPKAFGMICISSKIIFTYLDIDNDHLRVINGDNEKDCCHNYRSYIHYSRPFDFMNAEDRSEILEALFLFGYIQSSEYELYRC